MCFTAEETALIDGIIVSYFAPQSVSEPIRLRYFKTHKHLQEETIDQDGPDEHQKRSSVSCSGVSGFSSDRKRNTITNCQTSSLLSKH